MDLVLQIFLMIVGFLLLIKGADWFVDGASGIADKLHIPQLIIGLTIVAMGTSAPEAAISISASIRESADIAVGNVLGSNILNVLIVLGVTSVIAPLAVQKSTAKYELPFVIIISVIFAILGLTDNNISLFDGIILIALFVIYLSYLFVMTKKGHIESDEDDDDESKKVPKKVWLLIIMTLVGLALVVVGSNVTVNAATALAEMFGISQRFIGLTVVALGTSLPELVTSITAAIKKKSDIAIGNIVGSNIFNILFVIGISALITPVAYQPEFLIDSIVCIASVILLLLCILNKDKKLKRWGGALMLLCYAGYFVYLLQ